MTAERIQDVLRGTPVESRLLLALNAGETVISAAASLGISKMTARPQLRAVFGKVDVHIQRELVDLLGKI